MHLISLGTSHDQAIGVPDTAVRTRSKANDGEGAAKLSLVTRQARRQSTRPCCGSIPARLGAALKTRSDTSRYLHAGCPTAVSQKALIKKSDLNDIPRYAY